VLHVLINHTPCQNRNKTATSHIKMMHVIWWAVTAIGSSKFSSCAGKSLYPMSFVLNLCLMAMLFAYLQIQKKSRFGIQWVSDEDKGKKLFDA
jgi:predicted branched-subunit amino acid permease